MSGWSGRDASGSANASVKEGEREPLHEAFLVSGNGFASRRRVAIFKVRHGKTRVDYLSSTDASI
jgi:hypothetical protein